jgi:nucleoid DNA-binding protein
VSEKDQQDQSEQDGPNRVSKREFLAQVSGRSHIPARTVSRVYDTIIAELMDTMRRGDQLMLTGFGKFYPQAHKGHRVQFADNGASAIDDYFVLKFSATRNVNKALAQKPSDTDLEARERFFEAELELGDESESTATDETEAEDETKLKTATKTRRKVTSPAAVSLAAAAVQSTRAVNRAKRQAVGKATKGFPSDRAI